MSVARRFTCIMVLSALGLLPWACSAAASSTSKTTFVEANCSGGEVRPVTIVLACGDGAALAKKLVWTSWTSTRAEATGTVSQDNCQPDCARGTFIPYAASLILTERTAAGGREFFTRVTISYKKASPFGNRIEVRKDCYDDPTVSSDPRCPADLQNAV